MSTLSAVIEFVKVIGSAIGGTNRAVLADVTGVGDFQVDAAGNVLTDDDTDAGDSADAQPVFSALGVLGRPLPPDGDGHAEAMAARTSDGLEPFAMRDLRINRALGAAVPALGQVGLAGYGGAFASHQMTAGNTGSKRGNITVLYVPYEFDGDGVATKSHAIAIDPSGGIQLVHGDGVFFQLTDDVGNGEPGVVIATSATSFARFSASEVLIHAPKIMLKGVCYLGAQAEAGVPLLAGPASPPGPSIYISPA